jgi:hypothetical protein
MNPRILGYQNVFQLQIPVNNAKRVDVVHSVK